MPAAGVNLANPPHPPMELSTICLVVVLALIYSAAEYWIPE